jgi:hypothetical protein
MLHTVKKVEYIEEYKLKLIFNDGCIKIVNLENMIKNTKNMFVPLLDLNYFKKVKCDGITICWPNGVDLCPDVLYRIGKNIKQSTSKRYLSRTIKNQKKPKVKSSRRVKGMSII